MENEDASKSFAGDSAKLWLMAVVLVVAVADKVIGCCAAASTVWSLCA